MNRFRIAFISLLFICLCPSLSPANAGLIEGVITDFESAAPIPFATIRVEGIGHPMVANQEGHYRLNLKPGVYQLKFSHIAHYSERVNVELSDSIVTIDVNLRPSGLTLKGMKVCQRAYDPAQRIIVEAIDRKADIFARLKSYSFEAYTFFAKLSWRGILDRIQRSGYVA